MAKTRKTDPLARRHGESNLQWRSRVAAHKQNQRDKSEPIVPLEAQRHGEYERYTVRDLDKNTAAAETFRRRQESALERMKERGTITDIQYYAAKQIAMIAETIERNVSVRGASMEARVDCSGSAHDSGFETLRRVQLEQAYNQWRLQLPLPRRMVLDMVLEDRRLASIARRHNKGWRTAVKMLCTSLDNWEDCIRAAQKRISQHDVDASNNRLTQQRECA